MILDNYRINACETGVKNSCFLMPSYINCLNLEMGDNVQKDVERVKAIGLSIRAAGAGRTKRKGLDESRPFGGSSMD